MAAALKLLDISMVNHRGKLSRKAFLITHTDPDFYELLKQKQIDLGTESPHFMQSSTDYTTKDDFCLNSP